MRAQLRDYTIKPGELDAWVEEWRTSIAPLRRHFGFEVLGAWTVEGEDRFVWIMEHRGGGSWEAADAAYYGSAERRAIDPDPARHIAHSETRFIDSVTPATGG